MNNKFQKQDDIEKQINRFMDKKTREIDGELSNEFAAARQRALEAIPVPKSGKIWSIPTWLTGSAIAGFVLVAVWVLVPKQLQTNDDFDALIALTHSEDIEMLEEEMEFYMWLETEDV